MKKISRYDQFIRESIVGESDLAERPEILEFINHLKERTYDIVDDGYNVFLLVKRKLGGVNEGMFAKVFEYIIRSGAKDIIGFSYVSGKRVDIPVLERLVFDIDVRDNWGDSLPASDPRMMELHDVMHYEFSKFNII
jgi:hypothetical protein